VEPRDRLRQREPRRSPGARRRFDLLAEVLAATSTPPRVLVLNACETLDGADLLLPAVPVIIAMSDTIDDTAAIVFARRFYAAIASAQPVGIALAQAQAAMRLTTPRRRRPPPVAVRDDIDADSLVLVRPPGTDPT
jgi:CHAT domain-containing protein